MNFKISKFLMLSAVLLIMPSITNACEGTVIKGQSGKSYCLSNYCLNWYSAYAWCDAQGMKLMQSVDCGSYSGCSDLKLSAEESNKVKELRKETLCGGSMAWIDVSTSAQNSLAVVFDNGAYYGGYKRNELSFFAMCMMD